MLVLVVDVSMNAVNPPLTFYPTCPMRILICLVTAVGGLLPAAAAVTATRGGSALASRNYPLLHQHAFACDYQCGGGGGVHDYGYPRW